LYPSFATQREARMATYLQQRRGYYYLRFRVPKDLSATFPEQEFLKSLHTQDKKYARLATSKLISQVLEVFALLRGGFVSADQAKGKLSDILALKPKATSQEPVAPPSRHTSPTLQKVIEQYTKDHETAWTAKTRLEYVSYYRLLLDVIGDRIVSAIGRDTVRDLRDTLTRLPSNLYKKHPDMSIQQVLAIPCQKPMSTTTVNKLLTLFGSLMRHCVNEGYRKDNPTEGLKVKQNRRADEERKAYTREDLSKIMSALPRPAATPERYWIPMIGMYSGMRLGEICGLHVVDVKQVNGVWCFDVNEEDDKRLKTASSTRLVPVHPNLIELGFIRYMATMKGKSSVRLWPNLVRREIDGYCAALGNWYGRFNRKHITDDPQKCFHSLRHTFADTLKQAGVQESLIGELMGHANGSITTGRYGKRYQPQVLLDAICVLSYPGLCSP
jgi:integrase